MRKSFLEKILEWFKTTFNPRFEIEEKEEQKKEQETENQLAESKEYWCDGIIRRKIW